MFGRRSSYEECYDEYSTYRDVIYFRYRPHSGGGTIENWYVDDYGEPTELHLSEEVPGRAEPMERYRCLVCGQRMYEWLDVLDHFVTDEDDDEADQSDF